MDKDCCKKDLRSNEFYDENNIDVDDRNAGYNDRKSIKKHDKDNKDDCCCKKDLEKLFLFLSSPCIRDLINQESIRLGSTFFTATVNQIKKSCTCKGLLDFTGTITPGNGAAVTNKFTTSFCDLISISFQLVSFTNES